MGMGMIKSIADDARKIVDALQPLAGLNVARLMTDGIKYNFRIDAADIRHARAALPLAESLPGKIEELERERGRLRDVIERDRTKTAEVISSARGVLASRAWLAEGRGSYEFDDEKYQEEFGAAITEILVALDPLRALAADWSDCPKDYRGARIDWKARAEAAESQLAARDAELGRLRAVLKLAGEFCHSVDAAAEDLGGGFRPLATILKELGPAVDAAARATLAPFPEKEQAQ